MKYTWCWFVKLAPPGHYINSELIHELQAWISKLNSQSWVEPIPWYPHEMLGSNKVQADCEMS